MTSIKVCNVDGDAFYANEELIAFHSKEGGPRTFRLPEACEVTERFEERMVSVRPLAEFTETFQPMETRLYRLRREQAVPGASCQVSD